MTDNDAIKVTNGQLKTIDPEISVDDHWMQAHWRPLMGIAYFIICIFDFVIFPALGMLLPLIFPSTAVYSPWHPLTLEGNGLLHLAFGGILGVTAWGRSKEKVALYNKLPEVK